MEQEGGAEESPLFRSESLRSDHNDYGRIIIATPITRWIYSAVIALLVGVAVLFLCLGHYTRRATVSGQLIPSAGLVTVRSPANGLVVHLSVNQGQFVTRGQVLAKFEPLDVEAMGNVRNVIADQLQDQTAHLESMLVVQQKLADNKAKSLRENIKTLNAQLHQIIREKNLQDDKVAATQAQLKKISPLVKQGYVSAVDWQQRQSALLDLQSHVRELQRQVLDVSSQIDSEKSSLEQVPIDLASQQIETRNQLAQLKQSQVQNDGERSWELRAPRSGMVSALFAKQEQSVRAGDPVVSILPKGTSLEGQMLIASDAIGFIKPGQLVILRYNAFPYQKFGEYSGTVKSVSHSAISPPEVQMLYGETVDHPVYRVTVNLNQQAVSGYGEKLSLIPGMSFAADILLDRRRLIEWVIGPLDGFARRVFTGTPAQS